MQELGICPTANQSTLLPDFVFGIAEISLSDGLVEVEDYLQKESTSASVRNWSIIFFRYKCYKNV